MKSNRFFKHWINWPLEQVKYFEQMALLVFHVIRQKIWRDAMIVYGWPSRSNGLTSSTNGWPGRSFNLMPSTNGWPSSSNGLMFPTNRWQSRLNELMFQANGWPSLCVLLLECVVPENIQTPTTEGIGNSKGVGGSETQEIPEGRGVRQSNYFPG